MIIKTILAAFTAATMLSACTGAPSGSSADSTQGAESTADSASVSSTIEKITSEVEKLTEEITAGTSDSTKNDTAEETEMSQDVKYIALTFDDGPNATTTNDVIDKLEKYDIVASFFLIGNNINDESAKAVKRAYDLGCEINNHSRTHSNMTELSAEDIRAEFEYTDERVYEITGEHTKFFRPPYISVHQIVFDNIDVPFIAGIGAKVDRLDRHKAAINGSMIGDCSVDYEYIKKIRASYYLLGALLGKYKRAEVALPGGCNIGSRPIDQHLKGFRALGADVDIEYGKIVAEAEELKGTHLYFDVVTVGATINVMMAAAMADGLTIMENVAKEPHVVDVANFLNSMGANIRGAGTDVIKIRGVKSLHKAEYSIIPDQIEAGTFMFAAAATRGDVTVLNVIPKHLDATISKLVDIGCEVEEFDDAVRVVAKGRLTSTQVKTLPYPGYPTDMQPQIGVVLALAKGTSTITESIFENRFKYLDELARMGANVKVEGNSATIEGVEKFTAARVSAPDLRAGAALCIAGLATEGITIVDDIVYIQRGYERFEEKLRSLGGIIEKVSSEKEIQKFKLKVG